MHPPSYLFHARRSASTRYAGRYVVETRAPISTLYKVAETVNKIRDFCSQDEINLVLGGNVAKLYDLPLPHDRMFMRGRPDILGRQLGRFAVLSNQHV